MAVTIEIGNRPPQRREAGQPLRIRLLEASAAIAPENATAHVTDDRHRIGVGPSKQVDLAVPIQVGSTHAQHPGQVEQR